MAASTSTSSTSQAAKRRLEDSGGYEVVHTSPGLEVGVYVLVAPEPDRQQPHEDDEVYIVLEGSGTLQVEDEEIDLAEGQAMFVAAHAEHRFTAYERLSLLVIFTRPTVTRLVAATGAGVARLDLDGDAWQVELTARGSGISCLARDPRDPDFLIGGGPRDRRLAKRRRRRELERLDFPQPDVFSVAVSGADGAVYAGCEPSMLFVSRDRGERWTRAREPARDPLGPDLELPATAVDVARALDRAQPARRRPAARRDRARRGDAKRGRRQDLERPPARRPAGLSLPRLAPERSRPGVRGGRRGRRRGASTAG